MAYRFPDLSAIGYANGFTLWHYRAQDDLDAVLRDGYFDGASQMLRAGDFVMVNAGAAHATLAVTAAGGGKAAVRALAATSPVPAASAA